MGEGQGDITHNKRRCGSRPPIGTSYEDVWYYQQVP